MSECVSARIFILYVNMDIYIRVHEYTYIVSIYVLWLESRVKADQDWVFHEIQGKGQVWIDRR